MLDKIIKLKESKDPKVRPDDMKMHSLLASLPDIVQRSVGMNLPPGALSGGL